MSQSPRELARKKVQKDREQKAFLGDLLKIVDELDCACEHWQKAQQELEEGKEHCEEKISQGQETHKWGLKNLWQLLRGGPKNKKSLQGEKLASKGETLEEVVASAKEGVEIIREEFLEVLKKHQVRPTETMGLPFDSQSMYAVAREPTPELAENLVVKEVVRGYLWQDKILREAQVIVSTKPVDS